MTHDLAHGFLLFAGGLALALTYRTVSQNWTRIREALRGR